MQFLPVQLFCYHASFFFASPAYSSSPPGFDKSVIGSFKPRFKPDPSPSHFTALIAEGRKLTDLRFCPVCWRNEDSDINTPDAVYASFSPLRHFRAKNNLQFHSTWTPISPPGHRLLGTPSPLINTDMPRDCLRKSHPISKELFIRLHRTVASLPPSLLCMPSSSLAECLQIWGPYRFHESLLSMVFVVSIDGPVEAGCRDEQL